MIYKILKYLIIFTIIFLLSISVSAKEIYFYCFINNSNTPDVYKIDTNSKKVYWVKTSTGTYPDLSKKYSKSGSQYKFSLPVIEAANTVLPDWGQIIDELKVLSSSLETLEETKEIRDQKIYVNNILEYLSEAKIYMLLDEKNFFTSMWFDKPKKSMQHNIPADLFVPNHDPCDVY